MKLNNINRWYYFIYFLHRNVQNIFKIERKRQREKDRDRKRKEKEKGEL